MSRSRQFLLGAGALVVLGALLVGYALFRAGSVRGHLDETYRRVSTEGTSRTYTAPRPASVVERDIAGRFKPAQRRVDPSGYFLRYDNDIVAVLPEARGSRIVLDDGDRGYARWFPYVGGWWGTYSGPGETFRGGGPGAGK